MFYFYSHSIFFYLVNILFFTKCAYQAFKEDTTFTWRNWPMIESIGIGIMDIVFALLFFVSQKNLVLLLADGILGIMVGIL